MNLVNNTLEIFSANWITNPGQQSFVKLGSNNIFLHRGYNLFGIKGNYIKQLHIFDGCVDDWSEQIQLYVKCIYDNKIGSYDYLIMITHDDVTNKTSPCILQNYLIFLGCKKLKTLPFRGSYSLIYDLKQKEIVFESCETKYPIHEWFEIVNDDNECKLVNLGTPVYLIIYNLLYFTKKSVNQLRKHTKNIHIIDNRSTYPALLEYYENEYEFFLHKMNINHGHTVWSKELFWQFPQYFAISDPDLAFNKDLPIDFLNILKTLSIEYKKGKVGFALDISDSHLFYQDSNYMGDFSVERWEKQFWIDKIDNNTYELYNGKIDTTFCIINKEFLNDLDGIRIAGNFTCKHTPWYKDWYTLLDENEWLHYKQNNISSSTLQLISQMKENYNNEHLTIFNNVNTLINHMGSFISGLESSNVINDDNIKQNINECINLLTTYKSKLGHIITNN